MLRTRRQFLINGMQVSAAVPLAGIAARPLTSEDEDPILVIVQLSGGNDGLNMLVPHRQDPYFRLRPTLSHAPKALHALDADFGLHPQMGALAKLHKQGELAVVHGVGYPGANRSHFRSMDIWHTADLVNESQDLGWLGRMADQMQRRDPERLVALHVGAGDLPLALYGQQAFAPTARNRESFQLSGSAELAAARKNMLRREDANPELNFLHTAARSTYRAAERMQALGSEASQANYPGFNLAKQLKLVSQLIDCHFGPRIFHLEMTGFDTHVRQARAQGELLNELSESLAAFQRDLNANQSGRKVLTFVFSEFGRRVAENQSAGTDHGAAAPCFLMGQDVAGGLYGTPPDLEKLEEGDIPFSTDFRAIYSTLESDWMQLATSTQFAPLKLLS